MSGALNRPVVTLSFDDGHHDDLRVAERLARHGLKATFYVAFNVPGTPQITDGDIRELAAMGHEIGSHTLSHRVLVLLPPEAIAPELADSRARLEDIVGGPVTALSYPLGYRNRHIVETAQRCGYRVGRTQDRFRTGRVTDPMQMPVSVEFYPHPRALYARHLVRDLDVKGALGWLRGGLGADPLSLARRLHAHARRTGGVFHVTARSWEIAELDRWADLDALLAMIAGDDGVDYRSNGAAAFA
jgi:peptidoglycan/xylan/chitin deacetylase (PgdA/CDA1 family)